MKKILASDLDGTLIYYGELRDDEKKAIFKLKEVGHIFGVSTGRPYNGVEFLKEKYNLEIDFYVLLNGAFILDKDLNVLKHEKIDFSIVKIICNRYLDCSGIGIDSGYLTSILIGDKCSYKNNVNIESIDKLKDGSASLISLNFSNLDLDLVEKICLDLNKEFGEYIEAYRNSYYVDVVPKGCSKGNGVKLVANILNIDLDFVYTIGDSFNDVSMFKISNNSFTFPNVEEKLKEHANFIVESVSDCIYKYLL